MKNSSKKIKRPSGVALLAVLTVLTVLSLLAGSFAVMISIDESASQQSQNELALRMLYQSGAAHVKSSLMAAAISGDQRPGETMAQTKALKPVSKDGFGDWVYVKNENGDAIGRYRVRVEDEAAKLNLNQAYLTEKSKGAGWNTGEISIPNALGVTRETAQDILKYKYGVNGVPGDRGDDDRNNALLSNDGLDNNANGKVDENDEGVNDPGEYVPSRPRGDDRAFSTLREAMPFILESPAFKRLSESSREMAVRELYKRATLHSVDMPGSATLPTDAPSEINSITGAELRKRLNGMRKPVAGQGRARNQLAANLIDYRDENHVMTTLGNDIYGAEAICFNEVLANEDSFTFWVRDSSATDGLVKDWVSSTYWEDQYDSKDNTRLMHCPLWYYCCITDKVINNKLFWHHSIRMSSTWKVINSGSGGSAGHVDVSGGSLTLPDGPGENQSASNPRFLNCDSDAWGGSSPSQSYRDTYVKLINLMKRRGKASGAGYMEFENDMFKNMYAVFWGWKGDRQLGQFKVSSSKGHHIKFKNSDVDSGSTLKSLCDKYSITNGASLGVSFLAWSQGISAILPRVNWYHCVRRPDGIGRYYKVLVTNDPVDYFKGYNCRNLGVTGSANSEKLLMEDERAWEYKDGKPQKIDSTGWLDVIVKSSDKVNHNNKQYQSLGYIRLIAPEVVEMYNASDTTVSLHNWKVVCNTGTLATEIGNIATTSYYDRKSSARIVDDNPAVMPRSHFYLVNDAELFDMRYGNGDGLWGSTASEEIPVFEMDSKHWGISFKLKRSVASTTDYYLYIDAGSTILDEKLFQGESIRLVYKGQKNDPRSWNGRIFPLMWWEEERGKRIRIWNEYARYGTKPPVEGCEVMFLGLPARGGIVSLTLKNEYNQVTARTVEYGAVDVKEKGYSTEKEDPTHYKWIKRRNPTIGGTETLALNTAMKSKKDRPTWIKNGPFGSVAEMGNVRTANDFENLGTAGGDVTGKGNIANLSDYFCTGSLRLNAVDGNVECTGWEVSKYEVGKSDASGISAKDARWEPDQWKGHTMRYLTGPLRGESFAIHGNTAQSLDFVTKDNKFSPRSVPSRMLNKPSKGDEFTIGPGYLTPICYTRKSNQQGVWTWRDAIPVKGTYRLYVYGLNDAISTTEFLEENYNASLDVEAWNYANQDWEMLCKRKKYSKEDSFYAGDLRPDLISDNGDIKIRLTSHDVFDNTKRVERAEGEVPEPIRSGYAWFNYLMVSPVPVPGRVNLNTAPVELVSALPGVTASVARNIAEGNDENGRPTLKPYKHVSDILKVKGITTEMYKRFSNLVCIDSYVYTAQIQAELFEDVDHDGQYDPRIDKQTANGVRSYILKSNPGSDIEHSVEELEEY